VCEDWEFVDRVCAAVSCSETFSAEDIEAAAAEEAEG